MLVLLRISIGWHFLYSGIEKLTTPDFSASGFLGQAKGPLADKFLGLIPDYEGRDRLSLDKNLEQMKSETVNVSGYYQFDEQQKKQAQAVLEKHTDVIEKWFKANATAVSDLFDDWDRLKLARETPGQHPEPFGEQRLIDKQTQLRGKVQSMTVEVKAIHTDFSHALRRLLTTGQASQGDLPVPFAQRFTVDKIVTYATLSIGFCLIAGLFTRLAAFGGGLFLLSIVLAQPDYPGVYPPPHPSAGRSLIVNAQFVEMMALFALSTTRVGRWGGLDFFLDALCCKRCLKSSEVK